MHLHIDDLKALGNKAPDDSKHWVYHLVGFLDEHGSEQHAAPEEWMTLGSIEPKLVYVAGAAMAEHNIVNPKFTRFKRPIFRCRGSTKDLDRIVDVNQASKAVDEIVRTEEGKGCKYVLLTAFNVNNGAGLFKPWDGDCHKIDELREASIAEHPEASGDKHPVTGLSMGYKN